MSRKKNPSPCAECGKIVTTTKYCEPCRKIVHNRMNRERNRLAREEHIKMKKWEREIGAKNCDTKERYKGTVDKKWLVRGLVSANTRECAISCQA